MKSKLNYATILCALLAAVYQQSAVATTEYIATGTFYADLLTVEAYDYDTGDDVFIDAYSGPQPFNLGLSPSFTVKFTVDETVEGDVPIFSPTAIFDDAVSGVSMGADGYGPDAFTTSSTGNIFQFPGSFTDPTVAAAWSWTVFPDPGMLTTTLPDVGVFGVLDNEQIANMVPMGANLALFDSTKQIYDAPNSFVDLITLDLADFDGAQFTLLWDMEYSEEGPEPIYIDGQPVEVSAFYEVFGTIDTLTIVSPVPLPAAAWLFISALGGLVVAKRKQLKA